MAAFIVADEAMALESIAAKLDGRRTELVRLQDQRIGEDRERAAREDFCMPGRLPAW